MNVLNQIDFVALHNRAGATGIFLFNAVNHVYFISFNVFQIIGH